MKNLLMFILLWAVVIFAFWAGMLVGHMTANNQLQGRIDAEKRLLIDQINLERAIRQP